MIGQLESWLAEVTGYDAVSVQPNAGSQGEAVDVVSDGEFGKSISWSQYALERLSGFERRPFKPAAANPFDARRRPHAVRGILCRARRPRRRRHHRRKRSASARSPIPGRRNCSATSTTSRPRLKGVKVEEAFMPVAAPASVIPDRKNEYYKSDEEMHAGASARRCATEYRMIVDAGFLLQLDDARAAVTYDRMVPPASFEDYRQWLALQVEVLNHAHRRHSGRPHPLSRLLGKLAGPACHRRAVEGHRRHLILKVNVGAYRDRGRQSAPRA